MGSESNRRAGDCFFLVLGRRDDEFINGVVSITRTSVMFIFFLQVGKIVFGKRSVFGI